MTSNSYPLRFRLHGGRNTHAVRFEPGRAPFAACGQFLHDGDERQHEGTKVTCSACNKALAKAGK